MIAGYSCILCGSKDIGLEASTQYRLHCNSCGASGPEVPVREDSLWRDENRESELTLCEPSPS